jgi:sirohydrochlorin ferrochelatase
MAWTFSVLVVANVTATSKELAAALSERAQRDPCQFTLVVPAPVGGTIGREAAKRTLDEALARLREEGLEIVGSVGDHDPLGAVADHYTPQAFDEIVISTLPTGVSKWLQVDLPHRIERATDATVTHVIAEPKRTEPRVERIETQPAGLGLLAAFRAL